jgi:hypothetical protein
MKIIVERRLALLGVPADRIEDLERRIVLRTSIGFGQRVPVEWAKHVCVPTFLYQVHDDVLTQPTDVRRMFDNIPVADKKLQWINGTSARAGTAISNSSVAPSRCWSGLRNTCLNQSAACGARLCQPKGART